MIRPAVLVLTIVLGSIFPASAALAVTVTLEGSIAPERRPPAVPARNIAAAPLLPGIRLLTVDVALLPSGRLVARTAAARPALPAARAAPDMVTLPLPAALPLLLVALAGLVIAARPRPPEAPLAEGQVGS